MDRCIVGARLNQVWQYSCSRQQQLDHRDGSNTKSHFGLCHGRTDMRTCQLDLYRLPCVAWLTTSRPPLRPCIAALRRGLQLAHPHKKLRHTIKVPTKHALESTTKRNTRMHILTLNTADTSQQAAPATGRVMSPSLPQCGFPLASNSVSENGSHTFPPPPPPHAP